MSHLHNLRFNASCTILRFLDAKSLAFLLLSCKGRRTRVPPPVASLESGWSSTYFDVFSLILPIAKARAVSALGLADSPAWLLGQNPAKALEVATSLLSIAPSLMGSGKVTGPAHPESWLLNQYRSIRITSLPLRRGGLCNWAEALDELESWGHLRAASTSGFFATNPEIWTAYCLLRAKEDLMAHTFPHLSL
jgi:hypothetical protein